MEEEKEPPQLIEFQNKVIAPADVSLEVDEQPQFNAYFGPALLDHLKPAPRKECEIERYFKSAEELDICFYKDRDEKTTVTQKGKQAPVKSSTYFTAKIKRDKTELEVPIKTVLTDHYPNMGVTENQKIAGEPEFGEEPQDDNIEV